MVWGPQGRGRHCACAGIVGWHGPDAQQRMSSPAESDSSRPVERALQLQLSADLVQKAAEAAKMSSTDMQRLASMPRSFAKMDPIALRGQGPANSTASRRHPISVFRDKLITKAHRMRGDEIESAVFKRKCASRPKIVIESDESGVPFVRVPLGRGAHTFVPSTRGSDS